MANDDLMRLAAKWRTENGDYPEAKRDCAGDLERAIAQRAPLPDNASLVPGVMHCAKCKFRLHRTTLYVRSGTAGPGDSKTEPCPNGCGPLWPVTWEQEAREAIELATDMHEKLQASLHGAVPEGYVLVKRTTLSLIARVADGDGDEHDIARHIRALLAAAPAPDQSPDAGKMVGDAEGECPKCGKVGVICKTPDCAMLTRPAAEHAALAVEVKALREVTGYRPAREVTAGEVLVEVHGLTGSGKSAVAGKIEILCKALGLEAQWENGDEEKFLTHADWTAALELYNPRVRIVEVNTPRAAPAGQPEGVEGNNDG